VHELWRPLVVIIHLKRFHLRNMRRKLRDPSVSLEGFDLSAYGTRPIPQPETSPKEKGTANGQRVTPRRTLKRQRWFKGQWRLYAMILYGVSSITK
jgi:hypothetical protein